jgi:uroporphyrinogen decarboxylase
LIVQQSTIGNDYCSDTIEMTMPSIEKREVIRKVLNGERPPYVPWSISLTYEAAEKLKAHFKDDDLETVLDDHILGLGNGIGFFKDLGGGFVQDVFGVKWDRRIDRDIGVVSQTVLPAPTLKGYLFPDPLDASFFADIPQKIARYPDRLRVFQIGFSLYERAWTMRGMEALMMDFIDHPSFVDELFDAISCYNIAQVKEALRYDIDAVYFGDDWGQQSGLQMGPRLWKRFIFPVLIRMYREVRQAGKYVFIHSCGDVDELFPDLIKIGVDCFNPFQPEVMDVFNLLGRYRGRLTFHGGLSTQRTLPYGTVDQVRQETAKLLEVGKAGSYIFAPAHSVEGDVSVENMMAFLNLLKSQPGYHSEG